MPSTQAIKSNRITILEKEEYRVDLEFNEEFAILHLPEVRKFNRTVYFDFIRSLEDFKEFFNTFGYNFLWVAISVSNKLIAKFVVKLGFEFQGSFDNMDVYSKRID